MSPTDDLPSLKVFEIRGEPGTFVALSHCWGTRARFVLDSNSLIQLLGGMDLNRLLPTFRNTVNVTRALGYRYLWIDSLCILQGSYDSWGNESSKMQEYYMNAILTIPLDVTEGGHHGFIDPHRLSDENVLAIPFFSVSGIDESGMLTPTGPDNEFVYLSHKRSPALAKILVDIWPNVARHSKKISSLRVPLIMRVQDFVRGVKNIEGLRA